MKKYLDLLLALAFVVMIGGTMGIVRSLAQDAGSSQPYAQQGAGSAAGTAATATPAVTPAVTPEVTPTMTVTPSPTAVTDIISTLKGMGQFTSLLKAADAAGVTQTLQGPGPYTVFAPTDAAFAKIPPAQLNQVLNNPILLKAVTLYHVVSGTDTAAQLASAGTVTPQEGEPITITGTPGSLMANNAKITQEDVQASNGIIQVVDTVLVPPSLASALGASSATPGPSASPTSTPSASPAAAMPSMPTTSY